MDEDVAARAGLTGSRPQLAVEQMPDDGHRYEIIDGALLVTPPATRAPARRRQPSSDLPRGLPGSSRFRRAGGAHDWVINPLVPSVTTWSLVGSGEEATNELIGEAAGEETLDVSEPFSMRITSTRLVEF